MKRILIIKLGALGDFIQATPSFANIRQHHKKDIITLLTTPAMLPLAEGNPHFDAIMAPPRRSLWNPFYLMEMRRKLSGFDMVYDLQTNQRSNLYYKLAGKPDWSGIAKGCAFPHNNPQRNSMHSLDRLAEQLQMAGLKTPATKPDLSYLKGQSQLTKIHNLKPKEFAVLIPGGSAKRPEKRWPHYTKLAKELHRKGLKVLLVGSSAESALLAEISRHSPAINLCGQTPLNGLSELFSLSRFVVGNDTGPMHITACTQTPAAVLFGKASNPNLCAPRGENVHIFSRENIEDISPKEVLEVLEAQV